jgi:hypothetical protein
MSRSVLIAAAAIAFFTPALQIGGSNLTIAAKT